MSNTIMVVEDDPSLREAISSTLEASGFKAISFEGVESALLALDNSIGLVISDVNLGKETGYDLLRCIRDDNTNLPIILMTAFGTVSDAVKALRLGANDYIEKPFNVPELIEKAKSYIRAKKVKDDSFIAKSLNMQDIKRDANKVAKTDVNVLITGESGTGKEVLANYIHKQSSRKDKPFVAINCAAIPEKMLESILFGYEKGAFTGAIKDTQGKFEYAQGGTIFLDEIGDMEAGLQAKLLRVLQEKEIEKIGSHKTIKLDVRVLSATNNDLPQKVKDGRFREDLFYRLNVFPIHLPSLKERKQDIPLIVEHLLAKHRSQDRPFPTINAQSLRKLITHPWPGNVRELENVLQRALVLCTDGVIREPDILLEASKPAYSNEEEGEKKPVTENTNYLKQREDEIIIEALKKHGLNRQKTAEALNISTRTLRYKISKLKERGVLIL
jgi:two-component system response regulator FlrC